MMDEINQDMDGVTKVSKVVRGYDDAKDDESDKGSADMTAEQVDKYATPLREAHSKYLQFLKGITIDKEKNVLKV